MNGRLKVKSDWCKQTNLGSIYSFWHSLSFQTPRLKNFDQSFKTLNEL